MKYRLKKNTLAEQAYVRDIENCGPLQKLERGQARILPLSEYPEPLKRFLAHQRSMLHVQLSAPARKKLEQFSRATNIPIDELARRWVMQGIAREAS
jgi:hypothetical protein